MFKYSFVFTEQTKIEFLVDECADSSAESDAPGEQDTPPWLRLDWNTCPNCSLPPGSRLTCPAMLAIRRVVEALDRHDSFELVRMTVERAGVKVEAKLPIQDATRSLYCLLLPLSTCPVMARLRPIARLHLPLSGSEHTAFRLVGMHLIGQYLRMKRGQTPDWELRNLLDIFREIHIVSRHLADRIRAATSNDAAVNGLILLDAIHDTVELSVERSLDELLPLFTGLSCKET